MIPKIYIYIYIYSKNWIFGKTESSKTTFFVIANFKLKKITKFKLKNLNKLYLN